MVHGSILQCSVMLKYRFCTQRLEMAAASQSIGRLVIPCDFFHYPACARGNPFTCTFTESIQSLANGSFCQAYCVNSCANQNDCAARLVVAMFFFVEIRMPPYFCCVVKIIYVTAGIARNCKMDGNDRNRGKGKGTKNLRKAAVAQNQQWQALNAISDSAAQTGWQWPTVSARQKR